MTNYGLKNLNHTYGDESPWTLFSDGEAVRLVSSSPEGDDIVLGVTPGGRTYEAQPGPNPNPVGPIPPEMLTRAKRWAAAAAAGIFLELVSGRYYHASGFRPHIGPDGFFRLVDEAWRVWTFIPGTQEGESLSFTCDRWVTVEDFNPPGWERKNLEYLAHHAPMVQAWLGANPTKRFCWVDVD